MNNPAFIEGTSLQWAWDSTSLSALKFCPRFYQLTIVEGWEPRKRSVDLTFGILMHSARERYYAARARGEDHEQALRAALIYAFEETYDKELGKPWRSEDPNKNRLTLIRTLVWYCDQWKDDPLETIILANGKPAVELSFRMETDYRPYSNSTYGVQPFVLCGHIDRLAKFNNAPYISDLKTTKHTLDQNYFADFSPDNQLSLYAFTTQVVWSEPVQGIIVDAAQIAVTFSRFQRGIVPRSQGQLDEWYRGLLWYLRQAEEYATEGFWPMNERACWRCAFKRICGKPPQVREQWLEADFTKRMWNPLEVRGDI